AARGPARGRRAADARDRTRADGAPAAAADRRIVARADAGDGRAVLRGDRRAQAPGDGRAAGRAEHAPRAAGRRSRLRDGVGSHGLRGVGRAGAPRSGARRLVPRHARGRRGVTPARSGAHGVFRRFSMNDLATPTASRVVRAPRGDRLNARSWLTEAPLRMLMNNLDPEVAERPQDLVVYGGIGKAARNWECFDTIVETLKRLEDDQSLLVQSGK